MTTVGHWRSYGSIEHEGIFYGQKAQSLRRFMTLPKLTGAKFTLALAIHRDERKDLAAVAANGWHLFGPAQMAGSPADYQRFIQGSKAEFGIAKSGYVASRCGWFNDRAGSTCCLPTAECASSGTGSIAWSGGHWGRKRGAKLSPAIYTEVLNPPKRMVRSCSGSS
jgi:hypothetical protein